MTTYLTYRNGDGPIAGRIKAAVLHFRLSRGCALAALVVHPSEIADAQAAAEALSLTFRSRALGLEVRGIGGCLVPEVWLELPRANGDGGHLEQARLL